MIFLRGWATWFSFYGWPCLTTGRGRLPVPRRAINQPCVDMQGMNLQAWAFVARVSPQRVVLFWPITFFHPSHTCHTRVQGHRPAFLQCVPFFTKKQRHKSSSKIIFDKDRNNSSKDMNMYFYRIDLETGWKYLSPCNHHEFFFFILVRPPDSWWTAWNWDSPS